MATDKCLIRRRIEIDAAHRVPDHGSKCFNLHGHRYVIEAECVGPVISEGEQTGMVMDFGFLKACMIEVIHDPCDHGLILWEGDGDMLGMFEKPFDDGVHVGIKLLKLPYVPTAENLAMYWHERLNLAIYRFFRDREESALAPELKAVHVWETPNCVATYPSS